MSCRCRWIDSASVRDLIAHGYSLIDRKPAVGVGATWRFAGTPPNLAASTHARANTEVRKAPANKSPPLHIVQDADTLEAYEFFKKVVQVAKRPVQPGHDVGPPSC